jgi:hypothetical protein
MTTIFRTMVCHFLLPSKGGEEKWVGDNLDVEGRERGGEVSRSNGEIDQTTYGQE